MAYMNQERKAKLVAEAKKVLKKYGVKATFSTDRHSISCNIKSGSLDLIGNSNKVCGASNPGMRGVSWAESKDHMEINTYHYHNHFDGKCLAFVAELMKALNTGNHDNSDSQTDYFDVGWYVYISVGKWNKPYVLER